MNLLRSSIISSQQFTTSNLVELFATAEQLRPVANGKMICRVLEGAVLANLFFEPSTRSRISFGAAFSRLGGSVCDTTGFQFSSMAKGESIADTARVISGYSDVMVVRHPRIGAVKEFANASLVPVINGGDGPGEHPTQALLDLFTICNEMKKSVEFLENLNVCFVGDLKYGRTVHSLAQLLSTFKGTTLNLVSPSGLELPATIVDQCRQNGARVCVTRDLAQGASQSDVVYVTRIQEERFDDPEDARRLKGSYSLNATFYQRYLRPGTVLLHPLPRDNSEPDLCEISSDLDALSELAIFRQTDNGIPVRMALFAHVLGVAGRINETFRPAAWRTVGTRSLA